MDKLLEIRVHLTRASLLTTDPELIAHLEESITLLNKIDPVTVATAAYLEFFQGRRDEIEKYLRMSAEEGSEALYEYADMFPYSWPSDEHPNFNFCIPYLQAVNWNTIWEKLKEMPNGSN